MGGGAGRGTEGGREFLDEADDHPNLRQMARGGTPVSQRLVKTATPSLFSRGKRVAAFFHQSGLAPLLFISYADLVEGRSGTREERKVKMGPCKHSSHVAMKRSIPPRLTFP